jgi:hypothetical protein
MSDMSVEVARELRDFDVKSFPCMRLDHGKCDSRDTCWCACHSSQEFKIWWMTKRANEVPDPVYQPSPEKMKQKAKDLAWEAWRAAYKAGVSGAVEGGEA